MKRLNKIGQEEMVGFAVIIIIVAVILLVILGFMLSSKQTGVVQSFEIESFIQASLQYTTQCENEIEFSSVQNLIISCSRGEICLNGKESCSVLNDTIKEVVDSSWNVGNGSAIKGYKFAIVAENETIFLIQKGNETSNYRGGFQDFASGIDDYEVSLNVYY